MTTNHFDDELLMAFADGELDPQQAAEIAAAVASDEEIARRVAVFRETRRLAKAAYDLDTPVPDALREKVAGAIAASGSKGETASVIPLRPKKENIRPQTRWNLPLAASIAALAGALAGYWFASENLPHQGQQLALGIVAETGMAEALSKLPSGNERVIEQAGRIQLIASFRDAKGVLCREFEIMPQSAAPAVAIACREGAAWRVTFAQSLPDSGGGYSPAAAAPVIDAYLETLAAGPPLSADEEKAALGSLGE